MRRVEAVLLLTLVGGLLAACLGGWGFVHDEPLAGPYRLVAVVARDQMIVCRSLEGGGCSGDGLPDQTVFAAGADERFIVIARHPSGPFEVRQPGVTEYYFWKRDPDEAQSRFRPDVRGPYDGVAFEREKARLVLPSFSVIFEDLQ
ncbi:MAG: hypothetical protein QME55_07190 [Brevundimonas sp.]|uniref:hypothetical protein n=1 Tax=Brevundimonas sp. TaxID=1871086 RepID=UPI0026364078|nr:hypothetical protein [Brevundimonas sp.]MDI6624497.1 hypothetical protein [Brevundimonas sp.]MDQ7813129.1 hypothetical protein [Brevundimonas sp.]